MLYNLTDMLLFGAFFAAAAWYRFKPELHKRLIVSATVVLAGAAVGRVLPGGALYLLVWLSPLFAMIVLDLVTTRRLHPVPLFSVAVLMAASFKVNFFALWPEWRDLGRALLGPFI